MNVTILERNVARIDRPTVQTGMTPEHRGGPLIPSSDPKATDPFLLLMEDWFHGGVFDRRPHRGIETCRGAKSSFARFSGRIRNPSRYGLDFTGGSRACKPPGPGFEYPKTFSSRKTNMLLKEKCDAC
jgi:hypothetical protein